MTSSSRVVLTGTRRLFLAEMSQKRGLGQRCSYFKVLVHAPERLASKRKRVRAVHARTGQGVIDGDSPARPLPLDNSLDERFPTDWAHRLALLGSPHHGKPKGRAASREHRSRALAAPTRPADRPALSGPVGPEYPRGPARGNEARRLPVSLWCHLLLGSEGRRRVAGVPDREEVIRNRT